LHENRQNNPGFADDWRDQNFARREQGKTAVRLRVIENQEETMTRLRGKASGSQQETKAEVRKKHWLAEESENATEPSRDEWKERAAAGCLAINR
jgi:hypothetical protein